MTPAQRAAERICKEAFGTCADGTGLYDLATSIIESEYAEREAAVAELEKQARLAATRLMRAYLDARDLNEAIGALAALEGR